MKHDNKKHGQSGGAEHGEHRHEGEQVGQGVGEPGVQASAASDTLVTQLEKAKAERDDLLARLQRVSADYMNYQKRAHRDTTEACDYGNAELIKGMLPVLDDMERAMEAARKNHDEKDPLMVGMQLVHDKALEVMGRFGLTVIKAQGEPFDPQMHQALMQEASDQVPPQTVLRELQKGYALKGRVARPAAVVVSKGPSEECTGGDITEADAED